VRRGGGPERLLGPSRWRHPSVPIRRPPACASGTAAGASRDHGRRPAHPARLRPPRGGVPRHGPAATGSRTRAPPARHRRRSAPLPGPPRTTSVRPPPGRSRRTANRLRSTARRPLSAGGAPSARCRCLPEATRRRGATPRSHPAAARLTHGRDHACRAWRRPGARPGRWLRRCGLAAGPHRIRARPAPGQRPRRRPGMHAGASIPPPRPGCTPPRRSPRQVRGGRTPTGPCPDRLAGSRCAGRPAGADGRPRLPTRRPDAPCSRPARPSPRPSSLRGQRTPHDSSGIGLRARRVTEGWGLCGGLPYRLRGGIRGKWDAVTAPLPPTSCPQTASAHPGYVRE
jgi:hypothetical protein